MFLGTRFCFDVLREGHPTTKFSKSGNLSRAVLETLKQTINRKKNTFLGGKCVHIFLDSWPYCTYLASQTPGGTPFVENENRSTCMYYRFLITIQLSTNSYISLNIIKIENSNGFVKKIDNYGKSCSLFFCSWMAIFEVCSQINFEKKHLFQEHLLGCSSSRKIDGHESYVWNSIT